jgi:hypothetical protein
VSTSLPVVYDPRPGEHVVTVLLAEKVVDAERRGRRDVIDLAFHLA